MMRGVNFWRHFWKIFKNEDLRPILGLAPSKLKICTKMCNGSMCAYRAFYLFRRIEEG